jgi:eukaryotic-like serine/threonine-protein kinase
MTPDIEHNARSATTGGEYPPNTLRRTSLDASQFERGSLVSLSLSIGGMVRDDPRVVTALEEYLEALGAGRLLSRDDFLARHTEIADALGQCLSGLEFIHAAGAQLAGSQPFSAIHPTESISPSAQLGDYRILREVGRGGMGVVYEAEQVSLGRHVALKVLPFAAAIDPKQRQRFQIEAQAAAQLHHPHIVPIFSVGCDHGIHYYAMQFVEGRSLGAILHELRHGNEDNRVEAGEHAVASGLQYTEKATSSASEVLARGSPSADVSGPGIADSKRAVAGGADTVLTSSSGSSQTNGSYVLSTTRGPTHLDRVFCRSIARLGVQAAEALDHAHGLGILHRDIKPANLLIDPEGALWITDFGLARFPSDLSLTHTGDMVGTLRYMSPEQALARRGVVDQRTDIYSLGITLYEILTLRPAFNGRDHQELLRQIALDEPTKLRRTNPLIPRDLETIVLKAMAKDPSSRYATAQELAADLKRFLDDRPILARRPGPVERSLRWALRHRELVATTAAILVVALIVSTAAIWAQARKTEIANNSLKVAVHKRNSYIIETWPLLDGFAMQQMGQVTRLLKGQTDPATREELMETYRQALNFYNHASELPPLDVESRAIIAKAHNRKGFTNAILSMAKADRKGWDPSLTLESEAAYHRSLELFETLHAEFPSDSRCRRYFAEALGTWGWGWMLMFTNRKAEAKPHYERAVQLLREQIRDAGASDGSGALGRAREGATNVLMDLASLAATVHTLAIVLEDLGQGHAAGDVRRQLDEDINVLAARFSAPDRRQYWAGQFRRRGGLSLMQYDRVGAALDFRLWSILDPNNAEAHNSLAWAMTSEPGQTTPFEIARAIDSARLAIALHPEQWMYWNTLGVAAFRAKDWKLAAQSLEKSIALNKPGGAIDFFFLAMTRWHQGKPEEAKQYFEQGATYRQHNPGDRELDAFYNEARALLYPDLKSNAKTHQETQENAEPSEAAQS